MPSVSPREVLRPVRAFLAAFRRIDPALYALWAAACTIVSARAFYVYMLKQTGGEWSAPLDDVFIHFDFARSTARGHPFEWIDGNGYSSGNTSLSYPFVLALGYLAGFRDLSLMVWAAIVAAASVFATLLAARRLFFDGKKPGPRDDAARLLSYLLPPILLGVGALDWSFWSGMEVAFFLAVWGVTLVLFFDLVHTEVPRKRKRWAWLLGLSSAMLVVTRPEAATTVAVFGLAAVLPHLTRRSAGATIGELLRIGVPSFVLLLVQSIANRILTGEWSANGAIVKLAINNPYLSPDAKLDDYLFNLHYAVLRNVEYHFTDVPAFGVILPALAAAAFASPLTRRAAGILLAQAATWTALVALNGQVRWQNERYTMPAVAWVLMAAALGTAALVRQGTRARPTFLVGTLIAACVVQLHGVATRTPGSPPEIQYAWSLALGAGALAALALRLWPIRLVAVAAALVLAHDHQVSKMRDQKWYFGRASRNIRDQHVKTGRFLKDALLPLVPQRDGDWGMTRAHRVLLGDAGAIPYAADVPALDIIGLGGYHRFPFARAGVNGLASTIELMEYVPPDDRPDVLAIYPSWWGTLPTFFASDVLARFPVEGNVICGGYEDVIYRADWHLLGTGNEPRSVPRGEAIKDELDAADVLSERRHGYAFSHPNSGWTEMKVLADPADATKDLLDSGRRFELGKTERFLLRKLEPHKAAHLLLRTAPESTTAVRVTIDGAELARLRLPAADSWVEQVILVPASAVDDDTLEITFANEGPGDFVDYHVWITQ